MMNTKNIIIKGTIFILVLLGYISCTNQQNILHHKLIHSKVGESPNGKKTRVECHFKVNYSQTNDFQIEKLLDKLYDSVMNSTGYQYRKHPNSCTVFLYETEEHYNSNMGQWFAKIGKSMTAEKPNFQINKPQDINETIDLLENINSSIQKEVFNSLVESQDRAEFESKVKYPMKLANLDEYDILITKFRDSVKSTYRSELIEKYDITETQLRQIEKKAYSKNWPIPRKKEKYKFS